MPHILMYVCVWQYFLDTGLATAAIDGRIVNTFSPGDFFGEVAFIATAASIIEVSKISLVNNLDFSLPVSLYRTNSSAVRT